VETSIANMTSDGSESRFGVSAFLCLQSYPLMFVLAEDLWVFCGVENDNPVVVPKGELS
jgi:hypothetical protein